MLAEQDWSFIKTASPHEGALKVTEIITKLSELCIGKRSPIKKKSTHPWLNDRVLAAVEERNAAAVSAREYQSMIECSEVMRQEREKYISFTSETLENESEFEGVVEQIKRIDGRRIQIL